MASTETIGTLLRRGNQVIEVEREEEHFTAIIENDEELERVRALPGVREVQPVQNGVYKVSVAADRRNAAMDDLRAHDGGICHHAYRPKDGSNTRYYLTDRLVVKFGSEVATQRIESILRDHHVDVIREFPDGRTFLLRVGSDAGMNPLKVANTLAGLDEVEYAEPNLVNRFLDAHTPADTHFPNQWHLDAWNGVEIVADSDVRAKEAWDVTRGSRDIVVAVLDDGFDLTHPDFSGPGKVVHPKDYVDGDSNPFPTVAHGDYHGTPCAGVAIAEENGQGVVGIAPGCAFMPVRFPLSADDNDLWDIFDFVGKQADVISCSWGPPPVNAPQSQLLKDKFTELATSGGRRKKGCVIVFAAGNYNAPLKDPANTGFTWRHPQYGLVNTTGPIENGEASHPHVIAVSASTSQNRKSAYSNWGAEVSVCAPSNNFHPLNPQTSVPGRGIWTTDNEQIGEGFTSNSRFTGRFGGTSSATPLVAGVAALVISANPDLTGAQVKEILENTTHKIQDPSPDPVLGNTHGSYDGNGYSLWFGQGKVDAAAAVARAKAMVPAEIATLDLALDDLANGNLAADGQSRLYKVSVGDKLSVALEGPAGEDFDLYVKRGSVPTVDDWDSRGYTGSANEKVTIDPTQPGDYYIMVRSYRGSGDYTLKVALE